MYAFLFSFEVMVLFSFFVFLCFSTSWDKALSVHSFQRPENTKYETFVSFHHLLLFVFSLGWMVEAYVNNLKTIAHIYAVMSGLLVFYGQNDRSKENKNVDIGEATWRVHIQLWSDLTGTYSIMKRPDECIFNKGELCA